MVASLNFPAWASRPSAVPCAVALALLGTAGPAAGQQDARPQQDPPVFRSGVQVVEVDVRVFGKDGRFVPDLTRSDFELLENGTPQQLLNVFLVDGSRPASPSTVADPEPAGSDVAAGAPPAAPARQTWIFVFDLNHMMPGAGFDRARNAVETFIRDRYNEGDMGGILAGARMVNNRLTSVRQELLAAVKSVKPNSEMRSLYMELTREWPRLQDPWEAIQISGNRSEEIQRAVARACNDDPDQCGRADSEVREKARRLHTFFERATVETLTALNGLASGLAKLPGPKTIVLLSDGFVTERMEASLQQVVGQTARAGARVYAIDVRGLSRGRGAGIIDQPAADDPAGGPAAFDMQADGPNSLAIDTGGLMIRNENNIGRALDRIARDADTYYVLAYQPVNAGFDGRFRPIEVRVKRPDVRVRARRGYVALEPSRMLVPQPVKSAPGHPDGDTSDIVPHPRTEAAPAVAPLSGTSGIGTSMPVSLPVPSSVRGGARDHVTTLRAREEVSTARIAPSATTARAAEGWARYARGDVEGAREALEEASRADAPVWVFYALGLSEFALQNFQPAAEAWTSVRTRAPELREVYFDLADAYLQMSDLTKALAVLRDGEQRWPSDPEFHNAIGVIHVRRTALDDAVAAFSKAIESAPDEALGYFNLGRAYEMKYVRSRRYVASQRRWIFSDADRRRAMDQYEQYLRIGGPYEQAAREAIGRLEWDR